MFVWDLRYDHKLHSSVISLCLFNNIFSQFCWPLWAMCFRGPSAGFILSVSLLIQALSWTEVACVCVYIYLYIHTHQSGITLWLLQPELNWVTSYWTGFLRQQVKILSSKLKAGEMGKLKELSMFDKAQIVKARWQSQKISKAADQVRCLRFQVVLIY